MSSALPSPHSPPHSSTLQWYQLVMLALVLWREARGCPHEEKLAIAHVIVNRATDPQGRWPKTLDGVICQQSQFTSIAPPLDAVGHNELVNATSWPKPNDQNWWDCCAIADEFSQGTEPPDPTAGANHYFSEPIPEPPAWADPAKMTLQLGVFRFYKL